jgi:hypothetical protein
MPTPPPPEEYRWKKGQSGNPAGHSKARRFTDRMIREIDARGADDAIIRVWLKAVLEGDFKYFKELIDRVEGKVTPAEDPKEQGEDFEITPDDRPSRRNGHAKKSG